MSGKSMKAALLAASLAASGAAGASISGDVVRIGVLSDMAGPYADLGGAGSVVAVEMAVEDFKAAHKPAWRIEVLSADHQNKTDVGAARVRQWYDVQGVDMVTDVLNSAVALAVSKLADQKRRIMINTGAATTRLTNEDCSPYTVHYVYDTYALSKGSARAMTRTGADSWFFLTADYAFGHALERDAGDAVKAAGGRVLGAVRHPLGTADFSSFLLQAQASKAKVVALANAGADTINAVKAAAEFGVSGRQIVSGLLVQILDVHALGLAASQGMTFTEGFYWDLDEDTRAWSRRFFAKRGRMPSMLHAGT